MKKDILKDLNKEQKEAVLYNLGPAFVLARVGTGKTKTLTTKVAHLYYNLNVSPCDILVLTFTNKAAHEMLFRIRKLTGKKVIFPYISTFHSFCYRFLKKHISKLGTSLNESFTVADEKDSYSIIKNLVEEFKPHKKDTKDIYKMISFYKTNNDEDIKIDKFFLEKYEEKLISNNMVDFENLLLFTKRILQKDDNLKKEYQKKFKYILVDEFQDTDITQYEILKLLSPKDKNLFVVGDPDQAIFSFRGAYYLNNYNFIKDYNPKIFSFNKNYRSVNNILIAADALIKNNKNDYSKYLKRDLKSSLGAGHEVIYCISQDSKTEADEISERIKYILKEDKIKPSDIAILVRTNYSSKNFEISLMKNNIPYIVYGGTPFFQKREIKDIIAYLKVVVDNKSDVSLRRVINIPRRRLKKDVIKELQGYTKENNISLYNALDILEDKKDKKEVTDFKNLLNLLKDKLIKLEDPSQIIKLIGDMTGYFDSLKKSYQKLDEKDNKTEKDLTRLAHLREKYENIMQIGSIIRDVKNENPKLTNIEIIEKTLDEINQQKYEETPTSAVNDKVAISTYHKAIGLGFDTVFLPAMEENVIPSKMVLDILDSEKKEKAIEEERRIAYLGITRAKRRLVISYARKRDRFRGVKNIPSRFIKEMQEGSANQITENNKEITVGTKVWHPKFKEGIVKKISTNNILTIDFKGNIKKIAKDFIGLEIIC